MEYKPVLEDGKVVWSADMIEAVFCEAIKIKEKLAKTKSDEPMRLFPVLP